MKRIATPTILIVAAVAMMACDLNVSGISNAPRATFSQLACLDISGDDRIDAADAADPSKLPDFNADDDRDEYDAAFLENVDIALDPARDKSACEDDSDAPEYLVAHGYFDPSDVSCDDAEAAVLLLGVGGGVKDLRKKGDAAGVRSIVDGLQKSFDGDGAQTIGVIAGQAMVGAQEGHAAMEQWLTSAVEVYFERFPCLRTVLVGHSHGAVTVEVIAARLEDRYADRIISVVTVDRIEDLYLGDLQARPRTVPLFNAYETNDGILSGAPYDAPNAENWDASGEQAPNEGDKGGELEPVNHTTIDNSAAVKERIIDEVMGHAR